MKKKEKRVPFTPRMTTRAYEGFIFNFVKREWTKSHLSAEGYEFDDLLQEAAIVFLVCRERYKDTVDNPKWFMALFSQSLYRHFVDLKRLKRSYNPIDEIGLDEEPRTDFDAGYYWRVLRELPAELQQMLVAFCDGDDSLLPDLKARVAAIAPD